MRLQYPPNVRIVRTPCTGRLEVEFFMKAFEKWADGVCVIGCMEGDCHFKSGNFRARKRTEQVAKILDTIGIGGGRVKMFNLSSGEGPTFARYANEIHGIIMELGPNPLKLKKDKAA